MTRSHITSSLVLGLISWLVYDRVHEREAIPNVPAPLAYATPTVSLSGQSPELARLQKIVSWEFFESPLTDCAAYISKDLAMPVKIDEKALMDAAIGTDTLITFRMKGISARSALDLILRDHALAAVWWHECLLITTREQVDCNPDYRPTRVYPVSDLVRFSDKHSEVRDYDSLIDLLTSVVHPETWKEGGTGEGTIEPMDISCSIVVSQTEEIHAEIEQLLRVLREARRMQGMSGPPEVAKEPAYGAGCFPGGSFNGFGGGGGVSGSANGGGGISGGGFGGGVF